MRSNSIGARGHESVRANRRRLKMNEYMGRPFSDGFSC